MLPVGPPTRSKTPGPRSRTPIAVRAAVGQLLDYRHFFYVVPGLPLPSLLALFSESIGGAYIKFLESLSIASVWRSGDSWAGSSGAVAASLATRPAAQ